MEKITLQFTLQHFQLIVAALAARPYVEVATLMLDIQEQIKQQNEKK